MAASGFSSPRRSSLSDASRPTPQFALDTTFSHRKRTPFRAPKPPRPPTKSCPPVSRIFETPDHAYIPRAVSFKRPHSDSGDLTSPYYSRESKGLYFEQCFTIQEKLGEGSFGEVYKVHSKEDQKFYAVKRSAERFKGVLDRKKKLTEVEKHEKLSPHPNLVNFVCAWEERCRLYIQIELCMMTLAEYADLNGRLDNPLGMKFLIDLTRGVRHLHQHSLCHFDIKPANSFISLDGLTCKLGDFGLIVSLDDPELAITAQEGDPKYMAPELMRGDFGTSADIFSLGMSMLELSCDLELPGNGPQWHQLREEKLPEEFTQHLSPSMKTIVSSMLTARPQNRPAAQDILSSCIVSEFERKHQNCSDFLPIRDPQCASMSSQATGTLSHPKMFFISDDDDSFGQPLPGTPGLEVSGSDESATTSSGAHQNKSWLLDGPPVVPSPVYAGPPIPLSFGDSDGGEEMDDTPSPSHGTISFKGFVSSPTKTSSPLLTKTTVYPARPGDKSEGKKGPSCAPKNLFDAFDNSDLDSL